MGAGGQTMNPMGGMTMPGMMPGMPPWGTMPMGMPTMPGMQTMPGMPPMLGMPPMPGDAAEKSKKKKKDKQRRFKEAAGSAESGSGEDVDPDASSVAEEHAPRSPRRSRRRKSPSRSPERLEEVEQFLDDNRINEEAASKIRALSPASQRKVIARPLTGDVQNPSKVMIARVRELQTQNERMKGQDMWSAWGGAMMGATPHAINKYIEEHDLDESASRQLRSLPPHHQATALQWDLSKYRNPSAKFMSMASSLANQPPPRMPMMPMMHGMPPGMMPPGMMTGMTMPPMGMAGMPSMPGMPPMGGMPMPGMMQPWSAREPSP